MSPAVHQARWGENNPRAKLTERDVIKIRALLEAKYSTYVIAYRFNVSQTSIMRIKNGQTWQTTTHGKADTDAVS